MPPVADDTRLLMMIQMPQRYRQDLGDLSSLVDSMATLGLLHPIVITPDNRLIAGARRLEAAKRLGWPDIPVRVLDLQQLLHGEYDENEVRKDFTPTEKVAIGKAIEAEIAAENAAKQQEGRKRGGETAGRGRPKAATNGHSSGADRAQPLPKERAQRTDVRAAKKAGMGEKAYTQAKAVVAAATANPERFGDLPARMDAENNVEAAYKALQQRQTTDELGKSPRQLAHEDPGRRWTKSLHDLYVLIHSVQVNAGGDIRQLTRTWSPVLRAQYATQLQAITQALEAWITALEEPTHDAGTGTV